ncbi:hypothetical protein HY994_00700 [Candidatus Micrarchaeota archaeon]|nr:hypothetical protein [Candidatus Micrarchaeota archaeon]
MKELVRKIVEFKKKGGEVNLYDSPDSTSISYAREENRKLPWLELIGDKRHADLIEEINQHLTRIGIKPEFQKESNRIDCYWKLFDGKQMGLGDLLIGKNEAQTKSAV